MIFLKVKDLSPCLTKKDLKLNLSEWSLLGKVFSFFSVKKYIQFNLLFREEDFNLKSQLG